MRLFFQELRTIMVDLIELRNEIKDGRFNVYIKREKVYIEDSQNGECIMICDLKEVNKQK